MGLNVSILVQEYIKEVGGLDICCFVVGGKVIVVMKCQVVLGEFCLNLYCGGLVSLVCLFFVECKIVVDVVCILGLNCCGVDILCLNNGLVVMEVNLLLGLEGIEVVINKDVVGMIIEFIEGLVKLNNIRMKGKG